MATKKNKDSIIEIQEKKANLLKLKSDVLSKIIDDSLLKLKKIQKDLLLIFNDIENE